MFSLCRLAFQRMQRHRTQVDQTISAFSEQETDDDSPKESVAERVKLRRRGKQRKEENLEMVVIQEPATGVHKLCESLLSESESDEGSNSVAESKNRVFTVCCGKHSSKYKVI